MNWNTIIAEVKSQLSPNIIQTTQLNLALLSQDLLESMTSFGIIISVLVGLQRTISYKLAAILGAIFCLPFAFALTTAITGFKPFINLISTNGRATTFGLALFYIGLIGLPFAFLVNLVSMLSVKLVFTKWSIEGKVAFHPKSINLIIAATGFLVALIFGTHLIIDAIACLHGNISACD